MGNTVLSECRTGTSDQSDNNHLPTISDLTCMNGLNKKLIKNPQQLTSKRQQQQKSTHLSSQVLTIPQRCPEIQTIYQSLIKQKPIQYSIQGKQFLAEFNVTSLQQLKQKLINFKSGRKDMQFNKISLSSPQVKKLNIEHILNHLKIMTYRLQPENMNDSSIDKNSYRERILSRSFDLNEQDLNDNNNQYQLQSKSTPSLYNQKQFQITNKNYIYVGHVNLHNIPHGPGQLYSYTQNNPKNIIDLNNLNNQNNLKQNDLPFFIETQFVNGSILTNDIIIINQNGSYYRGGFTWETMNRKGKLHQNDGLILQGNFSNGLLQGKAKATYPDLGTYQGYFHQGLRDGKGIMTWKSKQVNLSDNSPLIITYEGYFKADQMQGLGNLKTPNYEYWGPFVSNMKQGKGTLKFNDGKKYQGWFEKDQISGYGQLHYPDGYVQKGIFPLIKQQ